MARFEAAAIRRYYDRHTPAFLKYGQGGRIGAIHRAVWGPDVVTRAGAFHYVDDRIADLARRLPAASGPLHLVDLGCGVGASLAYLAARLPIRGTGITLSPVQAALAAGRVREAGLSDRLRILVGDYCDLPSGIPPADLAYAIESFVHGPSPERFFAQAAHLVRPGGLLVICDDVLRTPASPRAARAVDRFSRGWHINTLLDGPRLRALAQAAGFVHESTTDLSPGLEIRRPRDRAIDLLGALVGWLPLGTSRVSYLVGGSALQTCLARGWIAYELVVFSRRAG